MESLPGSYGCEACDRQYPVLLGIPDFRVFRDPYIDLEDDREKARHLAQRFDETDFPGLIDYYWSITPDTPDTLVQRYVRHALVGAERGRHLLDTIERELPDLRAVSACRAIELGCRTGGVLVAAAERFDRVVGIDIAFRWLIVTRKRLEEADLSAQLVCCCAEFLPFPNEAFDLVLAENVMEHTAYQEQLITEAHRALKPSGVFFALTCNRYSLSPEPHVRVWGVGWLPRRWMKPYVRFRRGISYEHVRLLSYFELKRMVRLPPFERCQIKLPMFSEEEQEGLSNRERRLVAIYHKIKDWPIIGSILLLLGPVLQVICVRQEPVPGGDAVEPADR